MYFSENTLFSDFPIFCIFPKYSFFSHFRFSPNIHFFGNIRFFGFSLSSDFFTFFGNIRFFRKHPFFPKPPNSNNPPFLLILPIIRFHRYHRLSDFCGKYGSVKVSDFTICTLRFRSSVHRPISPSYLPLFGTVHRVTSRFPPVDRSRLPRPELP